MVRIHKRKVRSLLLLFSMQLGLGSQWRNVALYDGTGDIQFLFKFINCSKYWLELTDMLDLRFPRACYNMLFEMCEH